MTANFRACSAILCLILTLSPSRADDRIDTLTQDALQEAFRVLQRDYIRHDELTYEELNRAALEGLLRRINLGAKLVTKNGEKDPDHLEIEFLADLLTPSVGYIRLTGYDLDELEQFDDSLAGFQEADAETLILDLRAPQADADLNFAARILDRFVDSNTMLFKIQKPRDARPQLYFSQASNQTWEGDLILLVDKETCNAGEVIAALLDKNRECIVVGQKTPGATVDYEQIALNDTTLLRFAVAEVVLADESPLYEVGVVPDFEVRQDLASKHKVFESSKHGPIQRHIFEHTRPRINEAALVNETDPELDYHLARSRGEVTEFDRVPLQDRVLQRAIDLLLTMGHLEPDSEK